MFLVVDQSAIPIRNLKNRLVRPVILSVQNNPITFGGCDVRLEVRETNQILDKLEELIRLDVKFFVLIEKYFLDDFHYLDLKTMQLADCKLKETTYGVMNDFFAISDMA